MKESLLKLAKTLRAIGNKNASVKIEKIAEEYGRETFDSSEDSSEFMMDYSKARSQRNKFMQSIIEMDDKLYFVKSLFISGDLSSGGNPLGRRLLSKMVNRDVFKKYDDAFVFKAEFRDMTSEEFDYLKGIKGSAENKFKEMIDSFYVNPSNPYTTSLQPLYDEEDYEYKLNSSGKPSLPDFNQPELKTTIKSKEKHSSGLRPGSDYMPKYDAIVEFVILIEDPEIQSEKNSEESKEILRKRKEDKKLKLARGFLMSLHKLVLDCEDIVLNALPTQPEFMASKKVVEEIDRFKEEVGLTSLNSASNREILRSIEYPGPSGLRPLLYEDPAFRMNLRISGAEHYIHKGYELYKLK